MVVSTCSAEKEKKIQEVIERGTFQIIPIIEIPDDFIVQYSDIAP